MTPGGPYMRDDATGYAFEPQSGGVSRETPPPAPKRGSWARQHALLHKLRMEEGRTIPDIALLLGRTPKAVERELARKDWTLYPRYSPPNAQAEIAATVAKLEAEEGT